MGVALVAIVLMGVAAGVARASLAEPGTPSIRTMVAGRAVGAWAGVRTGARWVGLRVAGGGRLLTRGWAAATAWRGSRRARRVATARRAAPRRRRFPVRFGQALEVTAPETVVEEDQLFPDGSGSLHRFPWGLAVVRLLLILAVIGATVGMVIAGVALEIRRLVG